MKSSAAVIAESLSEFGRCLRETELPNDVETTERVLEAQSAEHDAIKVGVNCVYKNFLAKHYESFCKYVLCFLKYY